MECSLGKEKRARVGTLVLLDAVLSDTTAFSWAFNLSVICSPCRRRYLVQTLGQGSFSKRGLWFLSCWSKCWTPLSFWCPHPLLSSLHPLDEVLTGFLALISENHVVDFSWMHIWVSGDCWSSQDWWSIWPQRPCPFSLIKTSTQHFHSLKRGGLCVHVSSLLGGELRVVAQWNA